MGVSAKRIQSLLTEAGDLNVRGCNALDRLCRILVDERGGFHDAGRVNEFAETVNNLKILISDLQEQLEGSTLMEGMTGEDYLNLLEAKLGYEDDDPMFIFNYPEVAKEAILFEYVSFQRDKLSKVKEVFDDRYWLNLVALGFVGSFEKRQELSDLYIRCLKFLSFEGENKEIFDYLRGEIDILYKLLLAISTLENLEECSKIITSVEKAEVLKIVAEVEGVVISALEEKEFAEMLALEEEERELGLLLKTEEEEFASVEENEYLELALLFFEDFTYEWFDKFVANPNYIASIDGCMKMYRGRVENDDEEDRQALLKAFLQVLVARGNDMEWSREVVERFKKLVAEIFPEDYNAVVEVFEDVVLEEVGFDEIEAEHLCLSQNGAIPYRDYRRFVREMGGDFFEGSSHKQYQIEFDNFDFVAVVDSSVTSGKKDQYGNVILSNIANYARDNGRHKLTRNDVERLSRAFEKIGLRLKVNQNR